MHRHLKSMDHEVIGLTPKIYLGVVEDNDDPKFRGRVRVRVLGLHTENINETNTDGIKSSSLPWAERMHSIFGSSMTGNGLWGAVPLCGSWVYLFFIDGDEFQKPVYIGTLAGNPIEKSKRNIGFNDPVGYPEEKYWPREDRLGPNIGDPPFHIDESRKPLGESYLEARAQSPVDDGTDNDISTAFGEVSWTESLTSGGLPDCRYNLTYEGVPEDYTSEDIYERNGMVYEFDSTPEYQRIVFHHDTGSYFEIIPDGSIQIKSRGTYMYTVITGDEMKYTKGLQTVTIDGKRYLLIGEDSMEQFMANVKQEIKQELSQEIGTKKYTEVPEQVHEIGTTHKLSSENNTRQCNNFQLCALLQTTHSTQTEVLLKP